MRTQRAGAVIVGHASMTDFACSGLALDPRYGTPRNPPNGNRITAGWSSSRAVAAVPGVFVPEADTGGSVRISTAFYGLAGWIGNDCQLFRLAAGVEALLDIVE